MPRQHNIPMVLNTISFKTGKQSILHGISFLKALSWLPNWTQNGLCPLASRSPLETNKVIFSSTSSQALSNPIFRNRYTYHASLRPGQSLIILVVIILTFFAFIFFYSSYLFVGSSVIFGGRCKSFHGLNPKVAMLLREKKSKFFKGIEGSTFAFTN